MTKRLLLSLGFAITLLWCLRFAVTGSLYYQFLIGNIVLAAIPLLLEPVFRFVSGRQFGAARNVLQAGVAGLWLLFIPNAFYILTDFMHLNGNVLVNMRGDAHELTIPYVRGSALFVYDSLLVMLAVWFGAYAGGLALLHAFGYAKRRVGPLVAGGAVTAVMLLAAVGVYIGRYGRWNSWDALSHPWLIVTDLVSSLGEPVILMRFAVIVVTFMAFQAACLAYMWQLHGPGRHQEPKL